MTAAPAHLLALHGQFHQIIHEVGDFIRTEKLKFTRQNAEIKGVNDLVSYVDRTAEERLCTAFSRLLPGCGFINEEGGTTAPNAEHVFIIDPLDGTTNFVYDIPVFCISVGLQYQGQTVMGYVLEINRTEMYHAHLGGGAFLNNDPIRVSTTQTLPECVVATGFPFRTFDRLDGYLSMLRDFMQTTRGVRRLGSAALDLAFTAAGRFDGFFESNLNAWDVAAGALLVREAGGVVTDYFGGNDYLFGRTIVAGNPAIQTEMRRLIERYAL